MLPLLKTLFAIRDVPASRTALPAGERVYAIGDIHGCLDLFAALVEAIEADRASRSATRTTTILLGDLVDRGPDSAGVLLLAREWQLLREVRILMGNHEEMFLQSFSDKDILRHFLRHGGYETLASFGIDRKFCLRASLAELQDAMRRQVPREMRDFVESFEEQIVLGDYAFVHAGVDPAVALDRQEPRNLRWIREPFLSHAEPLEKCVVHGHTITERPVDNGVRIGVDTGAYIYGRLTCLVLEGTERRFIEAARGDSGNIAIRHMTAAT